MNVVRVIILASGNGERLGTGIPKQFLKVSGRTIIEHTIDIFENHKNISDITIVVHPKYRYLLEEIVQKNSYRKVRRILNGGNTRMESSYIGLSALDDNDKVLIHDAVRPFVTDRIIDDCISALEKYKAVDVAIPSADTIIEVNENEIITQVPNRNMLKRGQTPQGFIVGLIKKAHQMARKDKFNDVTDDCGLILKYNLSEVFVVPGEESNIKITYKEDLYLADRLFQLKSYKLYQNADLRKLINKVVVVFGGSKGIGKEIVMLAEKLGAKVYSFSRSNGIDIADYKSLVSALTKINLKERRIDYIVNTAGILSIGNIESKTIEDITYEVNVNYIGSINVIKASLKYLKLSKGSMLLFTSSSYTRGRGLYSVYSSTKAAVVNLVQGIHEEFAHHNVRINAINPERTNTPMRQDNFGIEPINTLLDPKYVAEVAVQTLISEISGQVIDVRKN